MDLMDRRLKKLLEYYRYGNYDSNLGKGYDKSNEPTMPVGGRTNGREIAVYSNNDKNTAMDDNEELDDFVNDINKTSKKKINKKIVDSMVMGVTDPGSYRQDRETMTKNKPFGINEYAGDHTNYIRKGISPFKQPKHSGPPLGTGGSGQAFKTTGNQRFTGEKYGWSKGSKDLTEEENSHPIWSLKDIKDPYEKKFINQQNRIKYLLEIFIKENNL